MDKLPPYFGEMLVQLSDWRGVGWLDKARGWIMVGPPDTPLPGSPLQWLELVARGYVGGERGVFMLTEDGRDYVAQELARRGRAA